MPAASILHPSFLQAINVVMLWPVHVQKVPQASEHLCPAKLQTRCQSHIVITKRKDALMNVRAVRDLSGLCFTSDTRRFNSDKYSSFADL